MSSPKIELLMSAMHQTDFSLAYRSQVHSDILIINQCDQNAYQEVKVDGNTWRMISCTERGSAKSRNMALRNSNGELCLFCDDDEKLSENYCDIIQKAYSELHKPAAIVFNVDRINNSMKKTYYRINKVRKAPIWRGYQTPMLMIDREQIIKADIHFNENFGAGAKWGPGEDPLFEYDILRKKLRMFEYPAVIAQIDYSHGSTWFDGYSEKLFYNLGAFTYYRYKNLLLRKARELYSCYKLRREKDMSAFEKLRWMRMGEIGFKTNVAYSEHIASEQQKNSEG